jgi:excisionase family DNA binding protein
MFSPEFTRELAATVADAVLARMPKQTIEQRYMSVQQAALYTGYSHEALWKHIQRGALPVSKEGKSVRIDRHEIDKWMLRNRQ